MNKKGSVAHYHQEIADILGYITKVVPTMEVKNSSPTRAGTKVQTRITWKEDGKKKLGYYSVAVIKNKAYFNGWVDILRDTVRTRDRACDISNDIHQVNQIEALVTTAVSADVELQKLMAPIAKQINAQVMKVIASGTMSTVRNRRNRLRAQKSLVASLDFALNSGIADDDVRAMLREAVVRHTMNS